MKRRAALFLCFYTMVFSELVLADAQVHEWIGVWDMNHDGWRGTLVISDSKLDCATSAWCHLVLKYRDAQGQQIIGKIDKIDQKFQHMTFYLRFPSNRQIFDAYLFSSDKKKLAGVTYWGGRTFGLYAMRK